MIDYASIGYKVKQIRLQKGITQEQLADAAQVGVTHISHLETGAGTVSLKVFIAILNFLECSADEILCKEVTAAKPYVNHWLVDMVADCDTTEVKIISDSVTSIGSSAFDGCKGLTSVTIPDGVTSIELGAFYQCTGLTSIIIPDSVASIGGGAFDGCKGLTSVTLPASITEIDGYAFSGCTKLTEIHYNGTTEQWEAISKDADWNAGIDDYTICCTDGEIRY